MDCPECGSDTRVQTSEHHSGTTVIEEIFCVKCEKVIRRTVSEIDE
ncbi:MAG: hypothetical protein SV377_02320 [Halobacteria archaeon]|nr:hypothetical protein [Halobacteria archaeon]